MERPDIHLTHNIYDHHKYQIYFFPDVILILKMGTVFRNGFSCAIQTLWDKSNIFNTIIASATNIHIIMFIVSEFIETTQQPVRCTISNDLETEYYYCIMLIKSIRYKLHHTRLEDCLRSTACVCCLISLHRYADIGKRIFLYFYVFIINI